jgi:predicted dehydrogenase
MEEEKKEINNRTEEISKGRRDALKVIATVPVLGAMAYGVYRKKKSENTNRNAAEMFRFGSDAAPYSPTSSGAQVIRLGIIGFGIRGSQLMQGLGFATPEYVENLIEQSRKNSANTRYQDFKEQDDLQVVITAVCDIFDTYAEDAVNAGANIHREGVGGTLGAKPKRYRHYKELLAAPDVDAVVIASPDHWHGTMAMDAIRAGKHVYLEKPMTWTVPDTYELRSLMRSNPHLVFQLGHQNRQIEA